MSSIFIGKRGLRLKYADLTSLDLASAIDTSTAVLLDTLKCSGIICLFDNSLDQYCVVSVVHPEADPSDPAQRLVMFELPCQRLLNFSLQGAPQLEFDPGTHVYIHRDPTAPPTCGKVRLLYWG
jgi:hypothetical protein